MTIDYDVKHILAFDARHCEPSLIGNYIYLGYKIYKCSILFRKYFIYQH